VFGGRADDVHPQRAGLGAGDHRRRVDLDAAHQVGADEDRVGEVAQRAGVVAGRLRGDAQAGGAGGVDQRRAVDVNDGTVGDVVTAYLATSPGGADVAAIIAASTPSVNLPFVLALQTIRLFAAIALSPLIIKFVVKHSPHLR